MLVFVLALALGWGWRGGEKATALIGASAGVLGGATSLIGPPVILHFLARGEAAARTRASIAIYISDRGSEPADSAGSGGRVRGRDRRVVRMGNGVDAGARLCELASCSGAAYFTSHHHCSTAVLQWHCSLQWGCWRIARLRTEPDPIRQR